MHLSYPVWLFTFARPFQIAITLSHRMKEQTGEVHDSSNIYFDKDRKQREGRESKEEKPYSPIDELGLMIDATNENDVKQLNMILAGFLQYPSQTLSQHHSEAMRLGNFDLEAESKKAHQQLQEQSGSKMVTEVRLCQCCGFRRHDQPIKLCTSFDDISNMGTSTYLFFVTFKNLSILLGILTVVYSIYALVTNVIASNSNALGNSYTVDYLTISLASKESNPTDLNKLYFYIQAWLGVVTVIIWILFFFINRYMEYKQAQEYDDETISISDYSVVLEGVPTDISHQEVQKSFDEYFEYINSIRNIPEHRKKPLKVVKLNVGKPFYLTEDALKNKQLEEIDDELENIREKLREWILQRQERSSFSESEENRKKVYARLAELVKLRVEKYSKADEQLKKKLKEQNSDQLTTVFVTFDTNIARNFVLYFNDFTILEQIKNIFTDGNRYTFKRGERVYSPDVEKAPEPEDIIWTNIGRTDCNTNLRKLFTFTVTAILLGGCFMIVYGLTKAQQSSNNDRVISIAISVVIAVVNILLGLVIRHLTLFEKDYTSTNRQASLAIKSIMAQMINSILTPVIIAYYIKTDTGIYQTGGLVDNIFMMSITNALVPPILLLFDPGYIVSRLLRWFRSSPTSKLNRSQKEHNTLYEGVEFEVGFSYIYIVNVFMFACFFVSLQPIVSVICLLGFLLMYWVQKYCMFNRYKRPVPGTDLVNTAVYQMIFGGPLIYSLGSLTWSNFDPNGIPKEALLPNIIAAVLSGLLLVLPINTIILACVGDNENVKVTQYEEDRLFFPTEYDRINPSTAIQGINEYKAYMQQKSSEIAKKSKEEQAQIERKKRMGWERGALNQNQANNLNMQVNPQVPLFTPLNMAFQFTNQAAAPPSFGPPPPQHFNSPQRPPPGPQMDPYGMNSMESMGGMGGMGGMNNMMMGPPNMGPINSFNPMAFSPYGGAPSFSPYGFGGNGGGGFGGGFGGNNGWGL